MPGAKDVKTVGRASQVAAPPGTPKTGPLAGIGVGAAPTWYHWSVTHYDGSYEILEGPSPPDPATGQAEGATVVRTGKDEETEKEWNKQQTAAGEGKIVTGPDGRKYRVTGDTMIPLEGQGEGRPLYRTLPDGSLAHLDPETGQWVIDMTKPQGPTVPEAPTLHTLPDGSQASWNPATGKWDVQFTKPQAPPKIDLGAPRAGQRTDLALVEAQANAYAQQLAADKTLTDEQRNQRWQQYLATTVQPAVQRATDEVNAEADRQRARQEEADRQAAAREARAASTADLAATTAERTEARSFAELQQRAGQNAVSNALALLPYQANPKFLEQYAAGLNVLARGGGAVTFTPDAFQVPLPDLDALAQAGADRAAALYRAAGGVPVAPRPAGGVSAPAAAGPALAPAYSSMPGAVGLDPAAALEALPLTQRPPRI